MAYKNKQINCGLLNVQSITQKTTEIRELITEKSFDILALTETWLSESDTCKIVDFLPQTHMFYHVPRLGRGGGVGIILSKRFANIKMIKIQKYNNFEHLEINFTLSNKLFKFVVIYRPPEKRNFENFEIDLQNLLNTIFDENRQVYICGDFNIWADQENDRYNIKLREIIENYNYMNIVNKPTTRSEHTLDLVLCEKSDNCLVEVDVELDYIARNFHKLVTFKLNTRSESKIVKNIVFRPKNQLNEDIFITKVITTIQEKINEECKCIGKKVISECVECLARVYNEVFKKEFDELCPLVTKTIIVKENCPWFNTEILNARKKRRAAEKKWKRRRTSENRQAYVNEKNKVNYLIKNAKISYYKQKITEAGKDAGKLYYFLNVLMGKKGKSTLPESGNNEELAKRFADFFDSKTLIFIIVLTDLKIREITFQTYHMQK